MAQAFGIDPELTGGRNPRDWGSRSGGGFAGYGEGGGIGGRDY